MTIKTFYLDEVVSAEGFPRAIDESAPADAPTGNNTDAALFFNCPSSTTGYVQGTHNSSDTISGTVKPTTTGPNGTTGDCYRIDGPLTGVFANTAWTLSFRFIVGTLVGVRTANNAVIAASVRVFRSANANGSSATEITSGVLSGGSTTLSSTAQHTSSISWSPGALTLASEYLFFKVALHVTTGSSNGVSTQTAVGSNASIVTPDFSFDQTVNVVGLQATTTLGNFGAVVGVGVVASGVSATGQVGVVGNEVFYGRDKSNPAYGWNVPFIGVVPSNLVNVGVNGVDALGVVGHVGAGYDQGGAFKADAFQTNAFQVNLQLVFVVGVSGTGVVGTLGNYRVDYAVTGVAGSGVPGTVTIIAGQAVNVTGVVGTGQVGTLSFHWDMNFTLPRGLYELRAMHGFVGAPALRVDSSPAPAGVVGTGAVGAVVYQSSVSPAGLQASGVLGSIALRVDSSPAPAGLQALGGLGLVAFKNTYAVTGVQATGAVGTPVVLVPAQVVGLSVQGGGQVGTVGFIIDCNVSVVGVQASALLNAANIRVDANVAVAGLASIGQVGTTTEQSAYAVLGVQGIGRVGTTSPTHAMGVIGVQGAGQVGTVQIRTDMSVFVTGVSAAGVVGTPEYPPLVLVDRAKMIYTRAPQPGH